MVVWLPTVEGAEGRCLGERKETMIVGVPGEG